MQIRNGPSKKDHGLYIIMPMVLSKNILMILTHHLKGFSLKLSESQKINQWPPPRVLSLENMDQGTTIIHHCSLLNRLKYIATLCALERGQ